jgi:hypothetical protein
MVRSANISAILDLICLDRTQESVALLESGVVHLPNAGLKTVASCLVLLMAGCHAQEAYTKLGVPVFATEDTPFVGRIVVHALPQAHGVVNQHNAKLSIVAS